MSSRLSRMQRLLLIYILYELSKPRILRRIVRHTTASTVSVHGNEMHTETFEDLDCLPKDGSEAMTDDLPMGSSDIVWTDGPVIKRLSAQALGVYASNKTNLKDFLANTLKASTLAPFGSTFTVRTGSGVGDEVLFTATVTNPSNWVTCAQLINGELNISRSGDIIPIGNESENLGGASNSWNDAYIGGIFLKSLYAVENNHITAPTINLAGSSRPASPGEGDFRYNSNTQKLEFYNGAAWETVTSAV